MAIRGARRTIDLAEIRCIPFHRLIERVPKLPTDSRSSEIVLAIEERNRTRKQNRALSTALRKLIRIVDDTRGIDKGRMDRRIGRLLRALPPDLSHPIAVKCISHSRKSRRAAGLKGLSIDSNDEEIARYCVSCYDTTGDERILRALVRHPARLISVEPSRLVAAFSEDDEYWQMRVVEAALRTDQNIGLSFSATHPGLFIWAAGRVGDAKILPEISRCFAVSSNKLELIGIVAWAYGKLGAYTELRGLRSVLDEFEHVCDMSSE